MMTTKLTSNNEQTEQLNGRSKWSSCSDWTVL